MQQLTCPKCQGAMRQYERSGVHVDQCSECRGIFLDRGELERLIDAETAFHSPAQQHQAPVYQEQRRDSYGPRDSYDSYGHRPHKKRKSFFEDLFD